MLQNLTHAIILILNIDTLVTLKTGYTYALKSHEKAVARMWRGLFT